MIEKRPDPDRIAFQTALIPIPEPEIAAYSICPKCGKRGSFQKREIPQGSKRYYWYCAHYASNKASKLRWCYIGKKLPT